MITLECIRERDVTDAIACGRWPDRCDEELRRHVSNCSICRDVALVAQTIQEGHAAAWYEARVPSAGLVWWRAEMRARQEAVRKAAKPIKIAEAVAGASAVGIAAALLSRVDVSMLTAMFVERALPLSLAVGMIAILIIAPVALFFVLSDD